MMIDLPKIIFKPQNQRNKGIELRYQTVNSANFDLVCDEPAPITLNPMERHAFATGTFLEGQEPAKVDLVRPVLVIRPRSGLAVRMGLDVLAGEVDPDYREEIKAVLINLSAVPVTILPGERIAQARWTLTVYAPGVGFCQAQRQSGFGSTGV